MTARTMSIGGATYDLFVRTSHDLVKDFDDIESLVLPLGDKISVYDVIETCGGGASNTSVGLSRLGCDAGFSGVVADDQWGKKLIENLRGENVDTRSTTIVEGEVSSFSIILSAGSGERVILYDAGANEHIHDSNFDTNMMKQMDWVYLNHIQRSSCVIQDDIVEILAENDEIRFTWNPGGCQIDLGLNEVHNRELLKHTDLLLLNKQEAEKFTGESGIQASMNALIDAGVHRVCITDGGNGAVATDGTMLWRCPILHAGKTVDTTGAGDAFGTGVTWALVEGKDLPTALKAGSINASSVVSHFGAQAGLLTDIEMRHQLKMIHLDVSESTFS